MLKYYIYILIILGLFTASFFFYNEAKILSFVQVLSSRLVKLTSKELNGDIANNIVLCIDKTSYLIFADNNHNLSFDKRKDKKLYQEKLNDIILEENCYSLTCKYDNKDNFDLLVQKDIPVNFVFFSPRLLQYMISFDGKTCFINFQKYLQ